jgi:protein-disulfide isomerase
MSAPTPRTDPAERRSARAQRQAAERAAAAAAARRRQRVVVGAVVAAVVAVVVGVGGVVQSSRDTVDGPAGDPSGVVDGAISRGAATAPVTVTVYEDFLCPACRAADERLGATYDDLVERGEIRLEHRPIAILDGYSDDRYSTRALNAAACVTDSSADSYPAFHDALFAAQPAEGGPGLSDDRLTEMASQAGAADAEQCIADLRFEDWTRRTTDAASRAGVNATPTILVGGAPLGEWSDEALRAAVSAARDAG